jgi:uncharacterized protein (TIGR02145 family)
MKAKTLNFILALLSLLMIVAGSCKDEPEPLIIPPNCIADIDRNIYKTVTIGSQVWMAENLKVTHYRNGDQITSSKGLSWPNTEEGAYCELNDHRGNIETFGLLYNGYAVMDSRKIAPEGWHIPSDAEWLILIDYLGGQMVAGGKLKDTSISWIQPNIGATNESGFTALPGGYRTFYLEYKEAYISGYWWSSTEYDSESIYFFYLRNSYPYTGGMTSWHYKQVGFSVRCVKD